MFFTEKNDPSWCLALPGTVASALHISIFHDNADCWWYPLRSIPPLKNRSGNYKCEFQKSIKWKHSFEKNNRLLFLYIEIDRFFETYSFSWLIFETLLFTWSVFHWRDRDVLWVFCFSYCSVCSQYLLISDELISPKEKVFSIWALFSWQFAVMINCVRVLLVILQALFQATKVFIYLSFRVLQLLFLLSFASANCTFHVSCCFFIIFFNLQLSDTFARTTVQYWADLKMCALFTGNCDVRGTIYICTFSPPLFCVPRWTFSKASFSLMDWVWQEMCRLLMVTCSSSEEQL